MCAQVEIFELWLFILNHSGEKSATVHEHEHLLPCGVNAPLYIYILYACSTHEVYQHYRASHTHVFLVQCTKTVVCVVMSELWGEGEQDQPGGFGRK